MIRILYALSVVGLVAGTAWAGAGIPAKTMVGETGIGLVILTALQR